MNQQIKTETSLRCLWQTRAMLGDALDLIAAALGADGAGQPNACEAPRSVTRSIGPAPKHATTVDFPRVGGRSFQASHTSAFHTAAWMDQYRAGEEREIYVGCCSGLAALARKLRMTIYKPGTCTAGGVWPRMKALRRERYGAASRRGDDMTVDQFGFDDWFSSRIYPRLGPSSGSPLRVSDSSIRLALPADLSFQEFDQAFDRRVRRGSLYGWIGTDQGRSHCALQKIDPFVAQRYTIYSCGAAPRISPAVEICAVDTVRGVDRLIAIAEGILVEHVTTGIILEP